jgi:hypothetical protein
MGEMTFLYCIGADRKKFRPAPLCALSGMLCTVIYRLLPEQSGQILVISRSIICH